ncbi:hypothetical protein WJX73_010274 [Symbiochloris irregularis]|uniref:Pentatricopeptide repeat-containing protein n=1 Tax=Symbiochloris irregularis TaxID=706552 RepID=A0AAW1NM03_9CHLO
MLGCLGDHCIHWAPTTHKQSPVPVHVEVPKPPSPHEEDVQHLGVGIEGTLQLQEGNPLLGSCGQIRDAEGRFCSELVTHRAFASQAAVAQDQDEAGDNQFNDLEGNWNSSAMQSSRQPSPGSLSRDPLGRPTIQTFNARINQLATKERRCWLIRLVYEEMLVDGVAPDWTTFEEALYQLMRARRVGDCHFFWNEMQRRGFVPNAFHYTLLISAFARTAHLEQMNKKFEEMKAAGLKPRRETYQTMLNGLAHEGNLLRFRQLLQEMIEAGFGMDESTYAAELRCHGSAHPGWGITQNKQELLRLLNEGRRAMMVKDSATKGVQTHDIIIVNAGLYALGACGHHEEAVKLFESIDSNNKFHPVSLMHDAIVASYLMLVEEGLIRGRLPAKASQQPSDDSSPAAYESASSGDDSSDSELMSETQVMRDSEANGLKDGEKGDSDDDLLQIEEHEDEDDIVRSNQSGHQSDELDGHKEYIQPFMKVFKEAQDARMLISPERCRDLIMAALDFKMAGHEEGLAAAHAVLDFMQTTRTFLNQEMGSLMLKRAVRRRVDDLTLANRVWEIMRRSGRAPLAEATKAYAATLGERAPDMHHHRADAENLLASNWRTTNSARQAMDSAEMQRQLGAVAHSNERFQQKQAYRRQQKKLQNKRPQQLGSLH